MNSFTEYPAVPAPSYKRECPNEYYQNFLGVFKPVTDAFKSSYQLARAYTDIALDSEYLSQQLLESNLALMDCYEFLNDDVREYIDGFLQGVDDTCKENLNG